MKLKVPATSFSAGWKKGCQRGIEAALDLVNEFAEECSDSCLAELRETLQRAITEVQQIPDEISWPGMKR